MYHALNRAVARLALFDKPADDDPFQRVLGEAMQNHSTRLLGHCAMSNHWRQVLWPREEARLTAFVRWLTHTHVIRCRAHYQKPRSRRLYQGRFNSSPMQRKNDST